MNSIFFPVVLFYSPMRPIQSYLGIGCTSLYGAYEKIEIVLIIYTVVTLRRSKEVLRQAHNLKIVGSKPTDAHGTIVKRDHAGGRPGVRWIETNWFHFFFTLKVYIFYF